jgi:hypothetical protein
MEDKKDKKKAIDKKLLAEIKAAKDRQVKQNQIVKK